MELIEAIQYFLIHYFQGKKSSIRTFEKYKNELDHFYHFMQLDGTIDSIENINENNINNYLNDRSNVLSLSRLNMIASHLKQFFRFLKRKKIIVNDPTLFLRETPVRTVIKSKELIEWENTLSGLSDNLKRLGKEQYKFQAVIESRGEKEMALFSELQRRLNRSERLLEDVVESKNELTANFIKELLPVIDGLDEAMVSINTKPRDKQHKTLLKLFTPKDSATTGLEQFSEGLRLIHDRLMQILQKANITPIKSLGEKFNPHEHLVIAVEARDDVLENTIIKELLKGYRQGDKVIRLAEVVVSKRNE